jgi:hypothetical protein
MINILWQYDNNNNCGNDDARWWITTDIQTDDYDTWDDDNDTDSDKWLIDWSIY